MKKTALSPDEITRKMLSTIRECSEKESFLSQNNNGHRMMLNEAEEPGNNNNLDAIAITDDPKFGQNVLTNQIEEFRTTVESGAQFTKPDPNDVSTAPLIYIPSKNNLVFSGIIPRMNNLKFQFVLKTETGNGCFVWADKLILNKENIKIINKLFGFYENWVEQWNMETTTLEKMANHIQND